MFSDNTNGTEHKSMRKDWKIKLLKNSFCIKKIKFKCDSLKWSCNAKKVYFLFHLFFALFLCIELYVLWTSGFRYVSTFRFMDKINSHSLILVISFYFGFVKWTKKKSKCKSSKWRKFQWINQRGSLSQNFLQTKKNYIRNYNNNLTMSNHWRRFELGLVFGSC